jgi:hypothetical protein
VSRSDEQQHFPYALQEVADALREERSALTPLELDRVKLRVMRRTRPSIASPAKGFLSRSRLTALVTVAFLAVGTGGALAVGGGNGFGLGKHHGASASQSQYRAPGCGKGDKNHEHTGPPGHPEFKPCPAP